MSPDSLPWRKEGVPALQISWSTMEEEVTAMEENSPCLAEEFICCGRRNDSHRGECVSSKAGEVTKMVGTIHVIYEREPSKEQKISAKCQRQKNVQTYFLPLCRHHTSNIKTTAPAVQLGGEMSCWLVCVGGVQKQ